MRDGREAHVRVVGLLAQDAHAFGDVVDEEFLIGKRLAARVVLIVELRRHRLQRVGEPAHQLLQLLLLFLQHANLGHQLLVRFVGREYGRRAGEQRDDHQPGAS